MFKNMVQVVCVSLMLSNAFAAKDLYVNLPAEAQKVLEYKDSAWNLKAIEERVVNDNIDIQTSYENLIQAQKKIAVARAQFFPYGAGTVGAMYFLNIWNPLLLVELVTSLPSKVYTVQSERNMSMAQKHNNKALEANIKNQVAHLYYNILKEESALKLAALEIRLLEALVKTHEDRIRMGQGKAEDLSSVKMRLLDLRDAYLKFDSYLAVEKSAFNLMIAQTPEEAAQMELQTVPHFLNSDQFKLEVDNLVKLALNNSPELVAADYMVVAASKNRSSAKWSILSFNGIGFGYWGRVNVAGSKIEEAKLNRVVVNSTLENQAHLAYNALERSLDHMDSEKAVFEDTAFFTNSEIAQYKTGNLSLDKLLETEILYLKDFRELVVSHYDSYIKLNDLERTTLTDMSYFETNCEHFTVTLDPRRGSSYFLSIQGMYVPDVERVEYHFDKDSYLSMISRDTPNNNFGVVLKLSRPHISGYANIYMKDGQLINQSFSF